MYATDRYMVVTTEIFGMVISRFRDTKLNFRGQQLVKKIQDQGGGEYIERIGAIQPRYPMRLGTRTETTGAWATKFIGCRPDFPGSSSVFHFA